MRTATHNKVTILFMRTATIITVFIMGLLLIIRIATMVTVLIMRTATISSLIVLLPTKNLTLPKSKSDHESQSLSHIPHCSGQNPTTLQDHDTCPAIPGVSQVDNELEILIAHHIQPRGERLGPCPEPTFNPEKMTSDLTSISHSTLRRETSDLTPTSHSNLRRGPQALSFDHYVSMF